MRFLRLDNTELDLIITHEDLVRLVVASIEAPANLRFGIFHGISNNRFKRYDISNARSVLGYEPKDDAFALASASEGRLQRYRWKLVIEWLKRCCQVLKSR